MRCCKAAAIHSASSVIQWTASRFAFAVSREYFSRLQFQFVFISYTYRNRERSDAIHRSVPAKAASVDRADNGLLHTSCSQFRLFSFFEIARPKAAAIHSASSVIQWTASRFAFAVSIIFLFRNCEAEGRGNPFCLLCDTVDCFTLRVRSFDYFSFSKLRGRRPRQSIFPLFHASFEQTKSLPPFGRRLSFALQSRR